MSSLENLTFIYNEDQSLFIGPSHAGNVEENEKEAMDREVGFCVIIFYSQHSPQNDVISQIFILVAMKN